MVAPVPPGGGAGGLGGGPPPPPPPLPPPGLPGLVGPAGPLGPQAPTCWSCPAGSIGSCYAGCSCWITSPRPRSSTTPTQGQDIPSHLQRSPRERLEAHLLRVNDWMDTYNILPVNKPTNFKHTLDHLAREWYDSLAFPIAWGDLQQRFSWYFSTQGRSIKHLRNKWRNFSFTPGQDDIEAYIRDVKEAAHQLNYNDEAVLHLIKATMPSEIYGTLYN